jgi:hypothetical protein
VSFRWRELPSHEPPPTEVGRLLAIGIIAIVCGLFLAFVVGSWVPDRSECISVPESARYVQSTGYWIAPTGAVMGYQPDPGDECIRVP